MKKFSKYIFTIAALALASTACVKEAEYEKGPQDVEGCYGVYFPTQEASGAHTYNPTMPTEVEFTAVRTNSEGDITVPVKYKESHEGIFQLGELVFADGQTESKLKVTFPNSEMGEKYSLQLSIEDPQYASRYLDGDTYLDFSVMRVEYKYILNPQTNQPAKFTFTQTWWEEVHTGKVKYYEVNGVRTCTTETDPVTYDDGTVGYGFWGNAEKEGDGELNFTWYTNVQVDEEKTLDAVLLEPSLVLVHPELAEVYCWDWFSWWTIAVPQAALAGIDFPTFAAKFNSTYPVSTYNNGLFTFNTAHYRNKETYGWAGQNADILLEAEGYTRTDYSLSLKAGQSENGKLPVTFTTGSDVVKVKYAIFEGSLYEAQVAKNALAIVDGTVSSQELTAEQLEASNVAEVSLEATGVYTMVAVSYDAKGDAQKTASVGFSYVAADDEVPVVVTVGLGSAQKYVPEGVDTDYALEYWIYGSDLEYVKFGVFSALDLSKGIETCIATVASSDPVKAETLAAINDGGFVSVVDGLNPGTEYCLLAIASNGYATEFFLSDGFYTTGDPHPVYMNFTMADLKDELIPESSEGYFGTYNYYAKNTDDEGNLISTRAYLGQVTISDSSEPDLPADSYGIVTEYVDIRGLFPVVTLLGGETDAITFEYYDGVLYNLVAPLSPVTLQGTTFYPLPVLQDADGSFYKKGDYGLVGGYVKEGYLAFVNGVASQGIDMRGFQILIYPDQTYTSPVSYLDLYHDVLLITPEKDDSGLAPEEDAPSASQLKQISNTLKQGPTNYVETPRGNIRSIIDKARQTPVLRGQFTGIQGERDAKAVSFSSEFSSEKVQKPSKNDPYAKVANISLR